MTFPKRHLSPLSFQSMSIHFQYCPSILFHIYYTSYISKSSMLNFTSSIQIPQKIHPKPTINHQQSSSAHSAPASRDCASISCHRVHATSQSNCRRLSEARAPAAPAAPGPAPAAPAPPLRAQCWGWHGHCGAAALGCGASAPPPRGSANHQNPRKSGSSHGLERSTIL